MTSPQPTMLWESSDPLVELTKRFRFSSSEDAVDWLSDTLGRTYGVAVVSVDRLIMSSYNLLAWLTTEEGPLLAKCCAFRPAHPRLLNAAELVLWLDHLSLPVSAPRLTKTGSVQVICDHLSVGVQRVISGALLDPTQLEQAHAAGVTLAQLHQPLATYARAADFAAHTPVPTLITLIDTWAAQKQAKLTEPPLVAGSLVLQQHINQIDATPLASQLVHGDYRAANILWHEGQIRAVLDFEEVRWGYRVNDLAWAAVHLGTRFHDWGPVSPTVHKTFLNSYTALYPLSDQEQRWLLPLILWHSLALTPAAGRPTYGDCLDAVNFYTHLLQSIEAGKGCQE